MCAKRAGYNIDFLIHDRVPFAYILHVEEFLLSLVELRLVIGF